MGTKFYKGVKIMDHGTHRNQFFPINTDIMPVL